MHKNVAISSILTSKWAANLEIQPQFLDLNPTFSVLQKDNLETQTDVLGILTRPSLWLIISHLKAMYIKVIIKVYKGGKVCIQQKQNKKTTDKIIVPVVIPWLKHNG